MCILMARSYLVPIEMRDLKGMNWNNPGFYRHTNTQMIDQISYHYVMPLQMLFVSLKLQKISLYAASIFLIFSRFVRKRLQTGNNP